MASHIALYVNDYTVDYGVDGVAAIENLMARARQAGILPQSGAGLFAPCEGDQANQRGGQAT